MTMHKTILFAGALLLFATPAHSQQKFDAIDLLSHVRELSSDAYAGREAGSPGNEKARAYVEAAFESAGLAHFGDNFMEPFEFTSPRENQTYSGTNLIGYVRGTESPDRYMVVSAHFDHLGERNGEIYNGADDNASGTAGLLTAAAYFSANPPKHSIIFAAFDAEEKGLQGARAFVANPPVEQSKIVLNINMDMISNNDQDELYAAGTHHYPFLKPYLEKVAASADIKLLFGHDVPGTGSDDWTGASDHGPFHAEWQLPFVYFGVEDHADYHKSTDDYETIEPAFFIQAVDTILDAIIELDANLDRIAEH